MLGFYAVALNVRDRLSAEFKKAHLAKSKDWCSTERLKILPNVGKEGLLAQPLTNIQKEGEEWPTQKT